MKSRSGSAFGYPFEAVTTRKRERMRKVALCYLKKIRQEPPARFDVLSISVTDGAPSIEHIRDAFDV